MRDSVLLAILLAGCPSGAGSSGTHAAVEPTLSSIQRNVFNPSCSSASCHGAPSFKGGLNLEAGAAYAGLVNVAADNDAARTRGLMRVTPGNPEASFLVVKLLGPGAGEGERMPSRNAAVSPRALAAIQEWIARGASQ